MRTPVSPWDVLEISPTPDARAIKRAYAILLKRPENQSDLDRFQSLHAAYASAMRLAQQHQEGTSDPSVGIEDERPFPLSPTGAAATNHMDSDATEASEFARLTLHALSDMRIQAQIDWLWQQTELVNLSQRARIENALLQHMMDAGVSTYPCFRALARFFEWSEPLFIRNQREQQLAMLHHAVTAWDLSRSCLDGLLGRTRVRDQLNDLKTRLQRCDPELFAAVQIELLRSVLQRPMALRTALWPLSHLLQWKPPEDDDHSVLAQGLRVLYSGPQFLECCIEGAAIALFEEIQGVPDFMAKRGLLATDPRLEDAAIKPQLSARVRSMLGFADEETARALSLHFGWPMQKRAIPELDPGHRRLAHFWVLMVLAFLFMALLKLPWR